MIRTKKQYERSKKDRELSKESYELLSEAPKVSTSGAKSKFTHLIRGIDISEHNGIIPWQTIKQSHIDFVIIHLGYGQGHLDTKFYQNVNEALQIGLPIGIYYYSYALHEVDAKKEANFVIQVLQNCGLSPQHIPLGIWYDMEDADDYKATYCLPPLTKQEITNMCSVFVNTLWNAGYYHCGIYANLDWWTHHIDSSQLSCPKWCAQYNTECDLPDVYMWQYTNLLPLGGQYYDGNILFP